ncbi:DNA-binding GntR family transcriptional regulator [Agrococcus sp. UYP10]|uniref:GntR family transcriptional regulator n=1 Tax=Agrococcus sp. UYP10 TaxID=1756355 RepID=UPI003396E1FF
MDFGIAARSSLRRCAPSCGAAQSQYRMRRFDCQQSTTPYRWPAIVRTLTLSTIRRAADHPHPRPHSGARVNGVQTLSVINSRPTAVVIADQLREGIIDGAFAPGDHINEAQVASQLHVSRGPVREALHRLVQEGLLLSRPNRGVFVQELTVRVVEEIYESREVIECAAAESIVKLSREQREATAVRLDAIVDRMQVALESDDWTGLGRIDLEFHTTLVGDAGNSRLVRAYATLATEALISLTHFPGAYPKPDRVLPGHREIIEQLRAGDMEALHRTLHRHLSLSGSGDVADHGVRARATAVDEPGGDD